MPGPLPLENHFCPGCLVTEKFLVLESGLVCVKCSYKLYWRTEDDPLGPIAPPRHPR